MKKFIIVIIAVYLAWVSLDYSGIFRDNSNPLAVAEYYLECLKGREWFLTCGIHKPETFEMDYSGRKFEAYKMGSIKKINLSLIAISDKEASVRANLTYRDKQDSAILIKLEKEGNSWLVAQPG